MAHVVAVSIDCWDISTASDKTLRLCSQGPLTAKLADGVRVQWIPVLYLPVRVGSTIEAEQYGDSVPIIPQNSSIDFAINDEIRTYIKDYVIIGRTFRVHIGDIDEAIDSEFAFNDFMLVYTGRISEVNYDEVGRRASFTTTDARLDLNKPLIWQLYGIEPTPPATEETPIGLRGKPKPELFGEGYSLEPTLEDNTNFIYRIAQSALWNVISVRVGGIIWDRVPASPAPGQWNLIGNAIQMGGVTLGGEVRVHAQALQFAITTTGYVMSAIVETSGCTLCENHLAELQEDAPYLIGYYAKEPINKQDSLDEIMRGVGGWWGGMSDEKISAGVFKKPELPAVAKYTDVNVASMELIRVLPPALRIRVEWRRNWQPGTQFYEYVTEDDRDQLSSGGYIAPAWELGDEEIIKEQQPRSIDIPLIRSLVVREVDAISIRNRLAEAWGVQRKVWRLRIRDDPPELMQTVEVDFQGVTGIYRVTSVIRSFGSGFNEVVLWG